MTDFERRVFEVVKTIPYGTVKTYAEIGMELGNPKLARAVGNALHKNPDPDGIPCFRVVHSDGRLSSAFAFGGVNAQKALLEAEGIKIENDRVVF